MIGQGMKLAMNEIYNQTLGPALNPIGLNPFKANSILTPSRGSLSAEELAAQRRRDALYKQGGYKGFEAGLGSTMAAFGKSDVGKFLGDAYSGTGTGNKAFRAGLAGLSVPVEVFGAAAKNAVDFAAKPNATSLMKLNPLTLVGDAQKNAFSGVVDPSQAQPTFFEQAGQSVIDNEMFGTGNPEGDARARVIAGILSIAGDPTAYLGVGAAKSGIKAGARAAARAGEGKEFLDAFKAQRLTDYGGNMRDKYQNPNFTSSTDRFGQIDSPNPTLAAKDFLDSAKNKIAVNKAALRASEYWGSNPANPMAIYDELSNAKFVKDAGIENSIPNLMSIVGNRPPEYFREAIKATEEGVSQAQAFLKSGVFAPARLRDTAEQALQRGALGYLPASINTALNKAGEFIPGGPSAALSNFLARHRSENLIEETLHPLDVPVDNARAYGPGTYFAQTPEASSKVFEMFGPNVYKMGSNLKNTLRTLTSKGYLDINDPRAVSVKNAEWSDPVIQDLIKQGYIGLRHGDALTNWLVGTLDGPVLKQITDSLKAGNQKTVEEILLDLIKLRTVPARPVPNPNRVGKPRIIPGQREMVPGELEDDLSVL
jgi:hypothetical protein